MSALMIVDDLYLVGVALAEFETDAPTLVDRHCPLSFAVALQLVQSDTLQRAQVSERFGDVQREQQLSNRLEIESAKLVRMLAIPDLAARRIPQDLIMAKTYYGNR